MDALKRRPSLDDVENAVSRALSSIFDDELDEKIIENSRRFFAGYFDTPEPNVEAGIGPDRVLYVRATKIAKAYMNAVEIPIRFV